MTALQVKPPVTLPFLTDGVIELRAFAVADAPALAAIWTDPVIRARNTVPEPTVDAALDWMRRPALAAAWEWAVVDAATQALAGRFALKDIDERRRRVEAAVWIAPEHRGRRFTARALRLAAPHAFAHGIVRIHAEVETDNDPSMRALEHAGMRHEGTLRANWVRDDGTPVDMHVYGMVAGDL